MSDKSQTTSYSLPDPLLAKDGSKIESKEDWVKIRRREILELFEENVYGKVPGKNVRKRFEVTQVIESVLEGKARQKNVNIELSNDSDSIVMDLLIFLPKDIDGPTPIFLGLNFHGNHSIHSIPTIPVTPNFVLDRPELMIFNNKATELSRGVRANRWPLERIIERGYGVATINYGDIDPDFDDGFQNGIHPLFYEDNQTAPADNQWGAIGAWSHGLSLAVDYFETDNDIDDGRIALLGHSRLGKAALWAGAQDERFSVVISNNSGCGGAALSKRRQGEKVEDINANFPHWFCKNFHQFNGKEGELPLDQHMLISLIAPRPVYVASAEQDAWADPEGEFLSLYHAGEVFALFGFETFSSNRLPEVNMPLTKGNMGYHIRSGEHDVSRYDWEKYMDFVDQFFSTND